MRSGHRRQLQLRKRTRLHVSLGVGESGGSAGRTADETEQVGALLVGTALLHGVALSTLGLEDLGSLSLRHDEEREEKRREETKE